MTAIRRATALVLSFLLLLGLTTLVSADLTGGVSDAVKLGIEQQKKLGRNVVEVELSSTDELNAADWTALKNNGVTFELQYHGISYRFNPSEISGTLGYETLNLSYCQVPQALKEAVAEKIGLEEDEFMLVLPSMLGSLPGTATLSVSLTKDFMAKNGYTDLNIYGVDFNRNVTGDAYEQNETYFVRAVGQIATGVSAEKSYAPWLTMRVNTSRMLLITAKSVSSVGSMGQGAMRSTEEITTAAATGTYRSSEPGTPIADANPNTGAVSTQSVLFFCIVLLGVGTLFVLIRTFASGKRR